MHPATNYSVMKLALNRPTPGVIARASGRSSKHNASRCLLDAPPARRMTTEGGMIRGEIITF
jgi:hypothetical protein